MFHFSPIIINLTNGCSVTCIHYCVCCEKIIDPIYKHSSQYMYFLMINHAWYIFFPFIQGSSSSGIPLRMATRGTGLKGVSWTTLTNPARPFWTIWWTWVMSVMFGSPVKRSQGRWIYIISSHGLEST